MLQPANTFNPQVPMNSPINQTTPFPPSPTGGAQTPMQAPQMPNPMNQTMGNPQTQSFAHGGRTRKRSKMIPVHVSKSELAEMVEAIFNLNEMFAIPPLGLLSFRNDQCEIVADFLKQTPAYFIKSAVRAGGNFWIVIGRDVDDALGRKMS